MENYLYFAEAEVRTGGDGYPEAVLLPAKDFFYADPNSTVLTHFYFKSYNADDAAMTRVTLTHGANNNKAVIKAFMSCINASPGSGGFVVVADAEVGTSKNSRFHPGFSGDVTAVSIQLSMSANDLAESGTTYGAGAISTYSAPILKRRVEMDVIITQLWVDLTGLGGKGGAADDAIGLPAGGDSFIYRNVVADNGIIFKYEISCIELPAAASGSATVDIDFNWNAALKEYDEALGTSEVDVGGLAAGETTMIDAPALTANDYLYLAEGDTAATDGVYSAGQFLFTFYGMPVDMDQTQY